MAVGMAGMAVVATIRVRMRPVVGMVLKVHASSTNALAVAQPQHIGWRGRRREPGAGVLLPFPGAALAATVLNRGGWGKPCGYSVMAA
jgi:hypothetical protein